MVRLIYTKVSSGKKKKSKSKKLEKAKKNHTKFLASMGISSAPKRRTEGVQPLPDYSMDNSKVAKTSDVIPAGTAPVKDILHDHLWKQGKREKSETLTAIAEKRARVGPAFNKGGLVYQTGNIADYTKVK